MIDELKGKAVRAIAELQLVNQDNWNAGVSGSQVVLVLKYS